MDTKQQHTAEPWFYGGNGCIMKGHADHSEHIASGATPEDARRIVACVNACAGISTESLEAKDDTEDIFYIAVKACQQRDELLEALKVARRVIARACTANPEYNDAYNLVDAAIAKAEAA